MEQSVIDSPLMIFKLEEWPEELTLETLANFLLETKGKASRTFLEEEKGWKKAKDVYKNDQLSYLSIFQYTCTRWVNDQFIFWEEQPVWQVHCDMKYHQFPAGIETLKDKNKFYRKAMRAYNHVLLQDLPRNLPISGPKEFHSKDGKWTYIDRVEGDLSNFKAYSHFYFNEKDQSLIILSESYEGKSMNGTFLEQENIGELREMLKD